MYNRVLVDLTQLQRNFAEIVRYAKGKEVIAVVKADAYGHGAIRICEALYQAGCRFFATASVQEAVEIAPTVCNSKILILGQTPPDYADILARYRFCQCVDSLTYATALSRAASGTVLVHLKFDSGMHRLGFACDAQGVSEAQAAAALPHLAVCGIFSHLADSAHPKRTRTQAQIAAFSAVCDAMSIDALCVHLCNSDAVAVGIAFGNTVRAGIALYGYPSIPMAGIAPILTWESRIVARRQILRGDEVGYAPAYCAKQPSVICCVPLGYADGFARSYCGATVCVGGQVAEVIAVCMDSILLCLPADSCVAVGDTVTLIGSDCSAFHLAKAGRTIPYEVLCRIGPRQMRFYRRFS